MTPYVLLILAAALLYLALCEIARQADRANTAEGALAEEQKRHHRTSSLVLSVKRDAFEDGVKWATSRRRPAPALEVVWSADDELTPLHDGTVIDLFKSQLDRLDDSLDDMGGWQS